MHTDTIRDFPDARHPLGRMYEQILKFELTPYLKSNQTILDFKSGTGVIADFCAIRNNVLAIEPDEEILKRRVCNNGYRQIVGDENALAQLPDAGFDLIVCPNTLADIKRHDHVLKEFARLLKPGGILSLVRINEAGAVLQKAIADVDPGAALGLLHGKSGEHPTLICTELEEILNRCSLMIRERLAVCCFSAVASPKETVYKGDWYENMLALELEAAKREPFREIGLFEHLICSKTVESPGA